MTLYLIWQIIKRGALDIWEELFYLALFNILWILGTLLLIPLPFCTFALFYILPEVSQGKGIKLGQFFAYGRQTWKQAYIWGGINLGAIFLLWANLVFYGNIQWQWAAVMQWFFLVVTLLWVMAQLVALPMYPRLEEPSFKLALRNAGVIMGRYPGYILVLALLVIVLLVVSLLLLPLFGLITFAAIAAFANRMVGTLVEWELERVQPAADE